MSVVELFFNDDNTSLDKLFVRDDEKAIFHLDGRVPLKPIIDVVITRENKIEKNKLL